MRIRLRFLRHELRERSLDMALIAVPIFIVSGLVVSSVVFWLWLWGAAACFR